MILETFVDPALAQVSYLIGCQQTGEALVIDPARDVTPYQEAAARHGLRITQAAETHIHADYVSGLRELCAQPDSENNARMIFSAEGGTDWQYAFKAEDMQPLHDGDTWMVGSIQMQAVHTPGHTPEHMVFLFTDTLAADRPMGIFTGDCLFVGDVGRPDLLETAVGIVGAGSKGATEQFESLQKLKQMPDYLLVFPGHGAGSACGKSLSAVLSSSLGYEKLSNPALQFDDVTAFSDWLLSGQPETPTYFAVMKRVNREGAPLLESLSEPEQLEGFILRDALAEGQVIDARAADEFNEAHIAGSLNIPAAQRFPVYAGWLVDYVRPIYLICDPGVVRSLTRHLRSIGLDNVVGYFSPSEVEEYDQILPTITIPEVQDLLEGGALIVDVRAKSEYDEAHIPGALHTFYGTLPTQLEMLPADHTLLITCASGIRGQIATSLLQQHGFENVLLIDGGMDAWQASGLPVRSSDQAAVQ